MPVPFEATVSYRAGTVGGPRAILAASTQVDLLDRETGHPFEAGIAMLDIPPQVSEWNDAARQAALPVIEAGGKNLRQRFMSDGPTQARFCVCK